MVLFPHAKVNIGLNILEKRHDGFHNIETVFYPVKLTDILEFIEAPDGKLKFENSGIEIGDNENNLCIKAYNILKNRFDIPPVHIHLNKIIPIGAGLGGGSSDGAFMLKGLNAHFDLGLGDAELAWLAADLGSDCPFFIYNKALYASGKGDEFAEIDFSLSGKYVVIVYPHVFVSTKEAYAGVTPEKPVVSLKDAVLQNIGSWNGNVKNQFELSVFKIYPELEKLKNEMFEAGALYASMSGSGSSVFGVFGSRPALEIFDQRYFIWDGVLE